MFAAIEVKLGETVHQAIGSLMHLAKIRGLLFSSLEVYSTFTISRALFVRFRSDLNLHELRESLLQDARGFVLNQKVDVRYEVVFPDAKGTYSASAMHATARPSERRKYRGTKDKFWVRQFEV